MRGVTTSGLIAFGDTLVVDGTIGNDMISGAKNVTINGQVEGTVFLAGSEIRLNEGSWVKGSIFSGSGNLKIYGTVTGDIHAGSGVLMIDGRVDGNVVIYAGEIVLSDKAVINGNLTYYSDKQLSAEETKHVAGEVIYKQEKPFNWGNDFDTKVFGWIKLAISVLWFLSFILIGLLIHLFPANRKFNYVKSNRHFWNYLLWGLLPFLIYPVAMVLFMVLVITIPIGFALLLAYLPLLIFTSVYGVSVCGEYLFRVFGWTSENRFLYFLLGSALSVLLSLIPFVNVLAMIFFSSLGWGIMIEKIFKRPLVSQPTSDNHESETMFSDDFES